MMEKVTKFLTSLGIVLTGIGQILTQYNQYTNREEKTFSKNKNVNSVTSAS